MVSFSLIRFKFIKFSNATMNENHQSLAERLIIIIITQFEMSFMRLHQQMSNTSFEAIVTLFLSIDHVTGYFLAPGPKAPSFKWIWMRRFVGFFPFLFLNFCFSDEMNANVFEFWMYIGLDWIENKETCANDEWMWFCCFQMEFNFVVSLFRRQIFWWIIGFHK